MKLTIIQPRQIGDRCILSEKELDKLVAQDSYDSYSRTYIVQGMHWRVVDKTCQANGTTLYTLECESEAE
jgi:hypothetical protein